MTPDHADYFAVLMAAAALIFIVVAEMREDSE